MTSMRPLGVVTVTIGERLREALPAGIGEGRSLRRVPTRNGMPRHDPVVLHSDQEPGYRNVANA